MNMNEEQPRPTPSLDALMREKSPFDTPLAEISTPRLDALIREIMRAKASHISVEQAAAEKAQAVLDEVDRIFTALMILRDDYAPGSPAYRALTLAGYEVTGKRPS